MELLFTSFIAGILTILAPCILPVIPIIVGGSLREGESKSFRRPVTIIASLAVSIVVFTLAIKASTAFIELPDQFWRWVSGLIIIIFGTSMVLPHLWDRLMLKLGLASGSNRLLARASAKKGFVGDVLIGAALGPVFTSCSPTYAIILATVLPVSLAEGIVYLAAYALGLAVMLLIAALLGGKLVTKLGWATDPGSKFRKILGWLFVVVGIGIIAGWDHDLQAWLIEIGVYDPISNIEEGLRN